MRDIYIYSEAMKTISRHFQNSIYDIMYHRRPCLLRGGDRLLDPSLCHSDTVPPSPKPFILPPILSNALSLIRSSIRLCSRPARSFQTVLVHPSTSYSSPSLASSSLNLLTCIDDSNDSTNLKRSGSVRSDSLIALTFVGAMGL